MDKAQRVYEFLEGRCFRQQWGFFRISTQTVNHIKLSEGAVFGIGYTRKSVLDRDNLDLDFQSQATHKRTFTKTQVPMPVSSKDRVETKQMDGQTGATDCFTFPANGIGKMRETFGRSGHSPCIQALMLNFPNP